MTLGNRWMLATALAAMAVIAASRLPPAAGQARQAETKPSGKAALKPGEIDLDKSRVYVRVGKKGLGHEHGVEGKIKSGSIDVNARKNPGEIEFDMTSFLADTDEARKQVELKGTTAEATRDKVTETMLGAAVLDVEQFPMATFKIKSSGQIPAKQKGELWYELNGDFTLHGQTHPLQVIAERIEKDGHWRLHGSFSILQSDYGITPYKAALGTVGVADELKIWGDIWIAAEKAKGKK
jgi:polyisoprenoid-binding protein YceI